MIVESSQRIDRFKGHGTLVHVKELDCGEVIGSVVDFVEDYRTVCALEVHWSSDPSLEGIFLTFEVTPELDIKEVQIH